MVGNPGVGRLGDRGGRLAGVRVVDVGDGSARLAGKLLAELGAHVVRLHRGDGGPPMLEASGDVLDWWFDGGTDPSPATSTRTGSGG